MTINLTTRQFRNFERKIDKTDTCWLWTAAKNADGYGVFALGSEKNVYAHRLAHELYVGPITKGLFVLHSCDNPACVRPSHLHLGTQQDNMAERQRRNRQPKGENHGRAKLKEHEVTLMRMLRQLAPGGYSYDKLGKMFGVSLQSAYSAINGYTWNYKG